MMSSFVLVLILYYCCNTLGMQNELAKVSKLIQNMDMNMNLFDGNKVGAKLNFGSDILDEYSYYQNSDIWRMCISHKNKGKTADKSQLITMKILSNKNKNKYKCECNEYNNNCIKSLSNMLKHQNNSLNSCINNHKTGIFTEWSMVFPKHIGYECMLKNNLKHL